MMINRRQAAGLFSAFALSLTLALPANALERNVTVINDTDFTIVRFYGSNKGSDSWEEDILGSDVLAPHSKVSINFDDGTGYCKFDFRAEFNDGDVLVRKDINICEIDSFTYN
jgi:hypothetical protein